MISHSSLVVRETISVWIRHVALHSQCNLFHINSSWKQMRDSVDTMSLNRKDTEIRFLSKEFFFYFFTIQELIIGLWCKPQWFWYKSNFFYTLYFILVPLVYRVTINLQSSHHTLNSHSVELSLVNPKAWSPLLTITESKIKSFVSFKIEQN